MRKNSKQSLMVLLMTVCLILTSIGIVPTYGSDDKRVLIINSYHYGLSWTDDIDASLIEAIQSNYGSNVRIYVEYMDWKEFPTEASLNQFEQSMIYKYKDKPIDLVVTSDDAALGFVEKNRKSLFDNVPVVFCGVSEENFKVLAKNDTLITGVIE